MSKRSDGRVFKIVKTVEKKWPFYLFLLLSEKQYYTYVYVV